MRFLRFFRKTSGAVLAVHEYVNPLRLAVDVAMLLTVAMVYYERGCQLRALAPMLAGLSFFLLGSNWLATALQAQVKESRQSSINDDVSLRIYAQVSSVSRLAMIVIFVLAFGATPPWLLLLWCLGLGLVSWSYAYRVTGQLTTKGPRSDWVRAMRD